MVEDTEKLEKMDASELHTQNPLVEELCAFGRGPTWASPT